MLNPKNDDAYGLRKKYKKDITDPMILNRPHDPRIEILERESSTDGRGFFFETSKTSYAFLSVERESSTDGRGFFFETSKTSYAFLSVTPHMTGSDRRSVLRSCLRH